MASPITQAIRAICDEKLLTEEAVLETVEAALAAAYRKDFGNKNQNIKCQFDPEQYDGGTDGIRIFDVKEVVADIELPDDYFERFEAAHSGKKDRQFDRNAPPAPPVKAEAPSEPTADPEDEFGFNPKTMIMLSDAKDLKPDAALGDEIRVELAIPAAFGRMAAQTAKQVIMQKLREAERNVIFHDFKEREGELMNVTVQRREGRLVLIDLGRANGLLLPEDQIETERYFPGTRIKALLREVAMTNKGPEIRLSRSSPGLVAALFAQEIPEIANGVVEIKDIAREPGSRTKVAVATNDEMIDPIGSCIGQRGTRIQTVIRELGGEKVDVVLWSPDESEYISAALSPAKTHGVELKREDHLAMVRVSPDQLSLAIGKGGQNVRLAAKLTGWKITVVNQEIGEVVADSDVGEVGKSTKEDDGSSEEVPVTKSPFEEEPVASADAETEIKIEDEQTTATETSEEAAEQSPETVKEA